MDFNTQDLVGILKAQRDTAMDEVARQGAIIKSLMRKNNDLEKQVAGLKDLVPPPDPT